MCERSGRFIRVMANKLLPVVNALIRLHLLQKIIKPRVRFRHCSYDHLSDQGSEVPSCPLAHSLSQSQSYMYIFRTKGLWLRNVAQHGQWDSTLLRMMLTNCVTTLEFAFTGVSSLLINQRRLMFTFCFHKGRRWTVVAVRACSGRQWLITCNSQRLSSVQCPPTASAHHTLNLELRLVF